MQGGSVSEYLETGVFTNCSTLVSFLRFRCESASWNPETGRIPMVFEIQADSVARLYRPRDAISQLYDLARGS